MTIRTVYVYAKSKKDINAKLAMGIKMPWTEYHMTGKSMGFLDASLPHGTVIKVYSTMVGGSPYAKAYGQWNAKLQRVK
jgi:hypothetical protein